MAPFCKDEEKYQVVENLVKQIEEIKKCFSLYVKFPKNRWKQIERAEKNDKEGNKIQISVSTMRGDLSEFSIIH